MIFQKKQETKPMANGGEIKPKMMLALEYYDAAITNVGSAQEVLDSLAKDWDRIKMILINQRNQLFRAVEVAGGMEKEIETAVHREFAPPRIRNAQDQES